MMKKKEYIAPVMEHLNLDIPSILAGTTVEGETVHVGEGGEAGYDEKTARPYRRRDRRRAGPPRLRADAAGARTAHQT